MTTLRKIVTVGIVGLALLAGRAAPAQVEGGDEECDYKLVFTGFTLVGTTIVPHWEIEVTCVRIIDVA